MAVHNSDDDEHNRQPHLDAYVVERPPFFADVKPSYVADTCHILHI